MWTLRPIPMTAMVMTLRLRIPLWRQLWSVARSSRGSCLCRAGETGDGLLARDPYDSFLLMNSLLGLLMMVAPLIG